MMNPSASLLPLLFIGATACVVRPSTAASQDDAPLNCYVPIEGGWRLRTITDASGKLVCPTDQRDPASGIGVLVPQARYGEGHAIADSPNRRDNPRLHRRPLYPPADRAMIWNPEQLAKIERYAFRPLVLAYVEPRFLFDYHAAGGLLGHLYVGLTVKNGPAKWFHLWSELDVRYVDGRMEYALGDPAFPGIHAKLAAAPLADSAGLVLEVAVTGPINDAALVWAYGGASAFFTNYAMTAPQFAFSPDQCSKDRIAWHDGAFTLRRTFDKSDAIMNQPFAAARHLPGWQAVIRGGSSRQARSGFGNPNAFTSSPDQLVKSAQWSPDATAKEKPNCVAVQELPLDGKPAECYLAVGMGGDIDQALRDPQAAWRRALDRNRGIADRITTHTPDPYLDAAVRMMAFANEGTWGDSAFVHGGWSWRFAYLGWRIWYGPDCYGWTDRVRKSIENHIKLNLVRDGIDKGAIGSCMDSGPGVYYNMNEVFLDHVRHYFDYTNDLELMARVFPVLEGVVAWENKRLQPKNEYLYENALNTWISDSHWYIQGQCTQASAYMLRAHEFLADLAKRLDKDPLPYKERAARIRAAMQQKLWMPRQGVFAECLDTRGHGMLHPEPELATIYHSAEFGAADPLQIYQMLHWADTHLRISNTPGGGRQYWSSNWFPNRGRTYTHSTYELAYAEELNFALTNYLAGRSDEAYALIRAAISGIFNGPTPGGLSCHSHADGRQRANDEFADASSMWGRAVAEGLFGIVPKRPDGVVKLAPQLPSDWSDASINTPHFSYRIKRDEGKIALDWTSPTPTAVHLRMPIRAARIDHVTVDGKDASREVEPGVDLTWLNVRTAAATKGSITIAFSPLEPATRAPRVVKQGDPVAIDLPEGASRVIDPQGVLDTPEIDHNALRGIVACEPGPALLFATCDTAKCPMLIPVRLNVEPKAPNPPRVWSSPRVKDHDLTRWVLVDLTKTYNAPLTEVLDKVVKAAQPPPLPASQIGWGYWKAHLGQYHGGPTERESDAAWRNKVGPDGLAWTTDGIPFKTSKTGPNIGVVTLAGGFPTKLDFPVGAAGKTLYLMISGITFPAQSHVTNLRVTLCYADGRREPHDLVSPFDIGDGWAKWCGRFHDTAANGFENLAGRHGPPGSAQVMDMTQPVTTDTEAHLVPFDLRPNVKLESVQIEAVANDVVFGVMGATILK
ncbi:MAG: DUF4450 domain-containing protein [Phycisphaerae bacterium]|nr:DUF4450 domain-containing protein [Phycisphaerae bacterium]